MTYEANKQVLLVCVFSLFIIGCIAVDRGRFKTCHDSDFCKRNREFAQETGESAYEVISGTESSTPTRFMVDLINRSNQEKFLLTITNYENDIIRVKLVEKAPLHPRYEVDGVLLDTVQRKAYTAAANSDSKLIFGSVEIIPSPFELRFHSVDGSGEYLRVNSKGLFNIEHFRAKPAEDLTIEDFAYVGDAVPPSASPYRTIKNPTSWEERFQSHTDSKPKGPASLSMDFVFPTSKNLYGIPEHASSLRLQATKNRGEPYRLYNLDVFEYELDETMALYGAIPLLISHTPTKSTAVFWLNASETWVDIDYPTDSGAESHWMSESGAMDFFVLSGPTPQALYKQYTGLTGTQAFPPQFSLAYHQCRWNYKDQQDISLVNQKFDEYDLPMDVLWLDIEHTNHKKYFTWDPVKFAQPKNMLNEVAEKGRKMVTIVDPHIKKESGYHIYDGGNQNQYWVKKSDGVHDYEGHCWPGTSMYLDFSDSEVRRYWSNHYQYDNYQGSTADLFVWNDMNEPSVFNGPEVTMQKDLMHKNSVEHRDLHNMFGYWVHQATHEGLIARDQAVGNAPRRSFVLSRAFFAGSQRFGAIWTGDNGAHWEHLKASVPMLLSVSLGGISFCGADVGGFFGNPSEELLIRWYQAGAFQPFFRAHAHLDTKRREPYLFSDAAIENVRQSLRARYQLLPYWYTTFYQHIHFSSGLPVMRPLWIDYPQDEFTFSLEDQYLIGSDLLVKPVTEANQFQVAVYLPKVSGGWFDYFTHQRYSDAGTQVVAAPLTKIPAFQRAGSILPLKLRARRASSLMATDPYTLIIALDAAQQASGYLYIDDGVSFDYLSETGAFIYRHITMKDGKILSAPAAPSGGLPSQKAVVVERIVILGSDTPINSATVFQQGFQLDAQVFTESSPVGDAIYVIKKPNAMISVDWKIELH